MLFETSAYYLGWLAICVLEIAGMLLLIYFVWVMYFTFAWNYWKAYKIGIIAFLTMHHHKRMTFKYGEEEYEIKKVK